MRFFLLALLSVLSIPAEAVPVGSARAVHLPTYAGGRGQDQERIRVVAEEEQLRDGSTYFFRFSMGRRRLLAYNLPHIEVMQACEFHRVSGGRIGDYKPKGMQPFIMVGGGTNAGVLFQHGSLNDDYNEVRVEKRFQFARGDTRIVLNAGSLRAFELFCAANGAGRQLMTIQWSLGGLCRWKPENWHKPESFPFQYRPTLEARITRLITTYCEP